MTCALFYWSEFRQEYTLFADRLTHKEAFSGRDNLRLQGYDAEVIGW